MEHTSHFQAVVAIKSVPAMREGGTLDQGLLYSRTRLITEGIGWDDFPIRTYLQAVRAFNCFRRPNETAYLSANLLERTTD